MLLQLFLCQILSTSVHLAEIDLDLPNEISEGEKRYGEFIQKTESYGDCWNEAMSELHVGCRRLTEEIQSRLALSFVNCFLKYAGFESSPCADDIPISNCLKNSSDRVFGTYTQFFTHTQSICHFLQYRQWQKEAAKTVLVLTENSQAVSRKLDEASKSQSKILDLQQAALNDQKSLISYGRVLKAELEQSRESAKQIYGEFKMTTSEQRILLFEVFDRMKNLQNFVLGEFTGVYTVAYYIIAVALIYILTSVPQTAAARIWLVLIITLNGVIERILATDLQEDILQRVLYERIWLSRKIICSVCCIILLVSYYSYKDYNIINNELLREIQQQNMELQSFIKGLTFHENIHSVSSALNCSTTRSSLVLESAKEGGIVISTAALERTAQRKTESHKKTTYAKSRGNKSKNSLLESSTFSELELTISPVSNRYNLRRTSSRCNSPQWSLHEGK